MKNHRNVRDNQSLEPHTFEKTHSIYSSWNSVPSRHHGIYTHAAVGGHPWLTANSQRSMSSLTFDRGRVKNLTSFKTLLKGIPGPPDWAAFVVSNSRHVKKEQMFSCGNDKGKPIGYKWRTRGHGKQDAGISNGCIDSRFEAQRFDHEARK